MVFNLPYLKMLAEQRPGSDMLLGKPFTVAALAQLLAQPPRGGFDALKQVQWLVDSPERLAQYRDLARGQQLTLRINLEIDVGLHRGGVPDAATMQHGDDRAAARRATPALVRPDGLRRAHRKRSPTSPAVASGRGPTC